MNECRHELGEWVGHYTDNDIIGQNYCAVFKCSLCPQIGRTNWNGHGFHYNHHYLEIFNSRKLLLFPELKDEYYPFPKEEPNEAKV